MKEKEQIEKLVKFIKKEFGEDYICVVIHALNRQNTQCKATTITSIDPRKTVLADARIMTSHLITIANAFANNNIGLMHPKPIKKEHSKDYG